MMATIFPFGEGKTEQVVFDFLRKKWFGHAEFSKFVSVEGKKGFSSEIRERPGIPLIVETELVPNKEVRVIAFRDLDEGESTASVRQSFQSIVWRLLKPWGLRPQSQEVLSNAVYKWEVFAGPEQPGLRFVLHIAGSVDATVPLRNWTTDGYILALGLKGRVLERFARESKVKSDVATLSALITTAIPDMISQQGINFDEDKDYLAAYLVATRFWTVRRTEEQARLIRVILDRAWKYDREQAEQVFKSWRIAIEEVVR